MPNLATALQDFTLPQVGPCCFFQSSPYNLDLLSQRPLGLHPRLTSEHPLQHYTLLRWGDRVCVVVVNGRGNWQGYQIGAVFKSEGKGEGKANNKGSAQIRLEKMCGGNLGDTSTKIVGMHLIDHSSGMLLFAYQNGCLEYNHLDPQRSTPLNVPYRPLPPTSKYHQSSLHSLFNGQHLLQQNQLSIATTLYRPSTHELIAACHDSHTGTSTLIKVYVQGYEVMAGIDIVLNVPGQPLQMLALGGSVLVNTGDRLQLWRAGRVEQVALGEAVWCTRMEELGEGRVRCCGVGKAGAEAYFVQVREDGKQNKRVEVTKEKASLPALGDTLLYFPLNPSFALSSRLQLLSLEPPLVLLPNLSATILSASLHSHPYSHYLLISKQIGLQTQHLLLTHSRIFTQVEQYQHNMLLRMAEVKALGLGREGVEIWVSSVVVGTLKLVVRVGPQGVAITKMDLGHKHIVSEEESLELLVSPLRQITQSQISTPKHTTSIAQLFQNKVESILAACTVGPYSLLLVQRQVHAFVDSPGNIFKRAHIYCFDEEVKQLVPLNNINTLGALLWNGTLCVLRLTQKQSVKMSEMDISDGGSASRHYGYDIAVNTVPYRFTVIADQLIIVSNDPLETYQPQKTTIRVMPLPSILHGSMYYPTVDISAKNSQRHLLLAHSQGAGTNSSSWRVVALASKYLVKQMEEITVEVEQLLAVPQIEGLLACIIHESVFVLLGMNRIIVASTRTGTICYHIEQQPSTACNAPLLSRTPDSTYYLHSWLSSQELLPSSLCVPVQPTLLSTHPRLVPLSGQHLLLHSQHDIWYASLAGCTITPISYFSISNDQFIQFRNNLTIHELESEEFMAMFAEKLPILDVAALSPSTFVVLYPRMLCIVGIGIQGALSIRQEILFRDCEGVLSIEKIIGMYDRHSMYMVDSSHRLLLMEYSQATGLYGLRVQGIMEEEVVGMFRVLGWGERARKLTLQGGHKGDGQGREVVVRRDGQLVLDQGKTVYI